MFPRYVDPIRTVAGQWRSGCSASATTAEKQNRCRFWGAGFFTFYQAIERLRRKLRPSAGLRSAEVLHFRIGDSRRACSRLWLITTDIARQLFGRCRSKSGHGANTANRSLVTHSRHRAGAGLYLQSCYDFASSYLLLPSRRLNSKADKDNSRRLVFRLLRQRLLPLRHNMRVVDFPVNASNAPRRQRPSYTGHSRNCADDKGAAPCLDGTDT
jgi:hypothetical protein